MHIPLLLVRGAMLALSVLVVQTLSAETLRLADIFTDDMVLQRQMPVPVWGWATPNSPIEVSFGTQRKSAKTDAQGRWQVTLDPMEAAAKGKSLIVRSGGESVQLRNTLVGEVWIASGQSNMVHGGPDLPTGVYPFFESAGDTAAKPEIRMRHIDVGASLEPLDDIDPGWRGREKWVKLKEPATASWNMPRYFARVLRDTLDVPIGMVLTAYSGTNQTAWMSRETLESFPGKDGKANYYDFYLAERAKSLAESDEPAKTWEDFKILEDAWRQRGTGRWPGHSGAYVNFPTVLYNSRIHPLAPLAFRGVVWHQGEGGPRGGYDQRMVAMFKQWRELFGCKFPVLVGTLSRNTVAQPPLEPATGGFYRSVTNAEIREVPRLFGKDADFDYVELYDLGNEDTHFMEKSEGGRRLGFAALSRVYGMNRIYTGPRLVDSKFRGNKVWLKFEHVGDGLRYQPSIEGISGIYLRGNGAPRWADVKVVNATTIECSAPGIDTVEYVAYGAFPNPHETLFNSAGLPGSPFELNPGKLSLDEKAEGKMISFQGQPRGTRLHLEHVRRDGYIFRLRNPKATEDATVSVSAHVPNEWRDCLVLHDGKPVPFKLTEDASKQKVAVFQIPFDDKQVIVVRKGAEADLLKVNRY